MEPSTAKSLTGSFAVLVEVLVHKGASGIVDKQKRRAAQKLGRGRVAAVKSLGKNLVAFLAGPGAPLPKIGDVDEAQDHTRIEDMLADRAKFARSTQKLNSKIQRFETSSKKQTSLT